MAHEPFQHHQPAASRPAVQHRRIHGHHCGGVALYNAAGHVYAEGAGHRLTEAT